MKLIHKKEVHKPYRHYDIEYITIYDVDEQNRKQGLYKEIKHYPEKEIGTVYGIEHEPAVDVTTLECNYKDDILDGPYEDKFKKGVYKKGKKEGEWLDKVSGDRYTYKQDMLDGPYEFRRERGSIEEDTFDEWIERGMYKNGVKDGWVEQYDLITGCLCRFFYKNGKEIKGTGEEVGYFTRKEYEKRKKSQNNKGKLTDLLAEKAEVLESVSTRNRKYFKEDGLVGKALHDAEQKKRLKVSKQLLKQKQAGK